MSHPQRGGTMAATSRNKRPSSWIPINADDEKTAYIEGIDQDGWFTETEAAWPGQKFSLALEEFSARQAVLFSETSPFQSVLVFRSAQYGNVLVLDGVIQCTTRDEFAYHEMMVHLPLCSFDNCCAAEKSSRPAAAHVLIVGGGDGGALREVVTQYDESTVQTITVVEIDPMVIDVAKKYFHAAPYFDDERVTVVHADAATFLKTQEGVAEKYHVIIGDTSDPVGPAESLFQPAFYESMCTALAPGGVICMQAESIWIHLVLISDLVACCNDIFDTAEYATTMVPTYPCGQIGFVMARKQSSAKGGGSRPELSSCRIPLRQPKHPAKLKWYSPEMHRAAFVLPPFVRSQLEGYNDNYDNNTEDDNNNSGRGTSTMDRSQPLGGERDANGSRSGDPNDDGDDEEDQDACFCNNVAAALPSRMKDAFAELGTNSRAIGNNNNNGESSGQETDDDCFLRGNPSKCAIM